MAEDTSPAPDVLASLREGLRVAFVAAVWILWIPCLASARGLAWTWSYLRSKPWRWITGLVILALMAFVGIKLVPLWYGRFALVYEAEYLARTSSGRTEDEMRRLLARRAFQLGYTSVMDQADAFSIEHTSDDDGIPLCTISIDLRQRVPMIGPVHLPLRIHACITKAVEPRTEKPKGFEEWLFGEGVS